MRLCVFGGTFDPIHLGHLRMAEEARDQIGLDRVLFTPNRVSPFKIGRAPTTGTLRSAMIQAAITDNPAFALCGEELERPGPSYTVDTLRSLREQNLDADLFFLTGADAIRDLRQWKEPEAALALARFVTFNRPEVTIAQIADSLPSAWMDRILFLEMSALSISSTDVRARVRDGRSIRYLTPSAVVKLIYQNDLYRADVPAAALW